MKYINITDHLYGIQKKLLIYTMLLVLIALLFVTAAVSVIMGKNIRKNLVEQYGYVNDKLYSSFQGLYENLEAITENCITNNNVQNSLKNKELSTYDKEVVSRTLQFVDSGNIDSYLYMDNKDNIYTRNSQSLDAQSLKKSYLYKGMGDDYSKVKLFWEDNIFSANNEKALYAGRYVRQFDRDYAPGVIYLKLDNSVFKELAKAAGDDSCAYLLLDSKGEICFEQYPDKEQVQEIAKAETEEDIKRLINNGGSNGEAALARRGVIYLNEHEASGYAVVTFVPNTVIYSVIWQMQGTIVLIFIFVLGIAFLLSRNFARQFTQPISYISGLMESFDDSRLSCEAKLHTNTELDHIGNSYNKMLKRISGLIEQVTFKERELRKAELDTLLYQLHPHFLYNTLDTVYMLARISREETIMQIIQALSKYLRINLSNGAEEITIEEELMHVKAYLDIQNIRKDGLFTYEIAVDEKLNSLPVIKMILQPVAENCIKHAFENMETDEEEARIWITVKQMDSDVVFTVENNGSLMPEKEIERLNRLESVDIGSIDSIVTKSKGGFGVWNVVKRLRLRYQEQIRFYYVVSAHRTSCVIKIKKELLRSDEKN